MIVPDIKCNKLYHGVRLVLRRTNSKIKNRYRWRIVIKCESLEKLISVLSDISDEFHRSNVRNGVDLGVDINPVNML